MFKLCDMHCDTATECYDKGMSLYDNVLHTDFRRLIDQGVGVQFFAVWISPTYALEGFSRATKVIDFIKKECEKHHRVVSLVEDKESLEKEDGKLKVVITIEGGEAIDGDIDNLHRLYNMGVRLMTLTWNGRNALGEGSMSGDGGLTPFGKKVVKEMNSLGMIVDVSHLSDRGFWDVAEVCEGPFVVSHSNSRTICNHPRNLTDEQIQHLIKIGGFMGLNLNPPFLSDEKADLDSIYAHVDHCLSLGGADVLGFGADFDGIDSLPCGIAGIQDMYKITEYLLQKGINQGILSKLTSSNLLRVIKGI
ncbi:MAG: dipeptidase [Eubacteriales bacterium]|nr:dipeptidase [Eubacteriales bacterium]